MHRATATQLDLEHTHQHKGLSSYVFKESPLTVSLGPLFAVGKDIGASIDIGCGTARPSRLRTDPACFQCHLPGILLLSCH